MKDFRDFLRHRLAGELPGTKAQNMMRPHPSDFSDQDLKPNVPSHDEFRNSSVLVPVITWTEEYEILLTLRTSGIKHGGQLSFPGGGQEGDETLEETALREAHEEIGLDMDSVSIAGRMTPLYVNHSDNMVTPVIGFLNKEQEFTPNPNEVEEIFTVPISELLAKTNHLKEEWTIRDTPYTVPFFDIHKVPLWGATAMMMSQILELYREFLDQP